MIAESWPWKRELAKHVHAIRRRMSQRRWPPSSLAAIERDLFVAAYAVRKLVEAFKISDEVEGGSLLARAHPRKDRPVDLVNRHCVDELYDLTISSEQQVGLRQFCNQVIHSFVFAIVTDPDGGLAGFFIASDRDKARHVFFFHAEEVVSTLGDVVSDQIASMELRRDGDGGPLRVRSKTRTPRSRA